MSKNVHEKNVIAPKGRKKKASLKVKSEKPVGKHVSFQAQVLKGNISSKVLGEAGESVAAYYFKTKGYRVIGRNIRFRRGEVDLLALKDGIIRIIEVKSMLTKQGKPVELGLEASNVIHETKIEQFEPEYNFTQAKISRLKSIAAEIISKYPYPFLHMIEGDRERFEGQGVSSEGEFRVVIEGLAVRIHVDRAEIKSIRVKHIESLVS